MSSLVNTLILGEPDPPSLSRLVNIRTPILSSVSSEIIDIYDSTYDIIDNRKNKSSDNSFVNSWIPFYEMS